MINTIIQDAGAASVLDTEVKDTLRQCEGQNVMAELTAGRGGWEWAGKEAL